MNRFLPILFFGLSLAGCNKTSGVGDLQSFTQNAYKDHTPEVEPLPALRPVAVFIYTASDQIDPFNQKNLRLQSTDNDDSGGGEAGPDLTRKKEPLEAYTLDSLKLVGIMAQHGIDWAVVAAPDDSVHRVTEGNYAGLNYGRIMGINGNRLSLEELIKNPVGKWEKKEASLVLAE